MPVPDGIGHDRLFPAVALQLATMLVAGGTARPFNALLCLLASLPTLYLLLSGTRTRRPGWVAATALALFAVAWLQLVPLPPAAWTALPGRDLAAKALAVAGLGPGWRPVALDPQAALSALISLVSPLVLLVAAARLSGTEQRSMLKAILAFALASAFLGLAQRLTGTFTPYDIDHAGYATGLFANRNHLAALLACALVLLPALFAPLRRRADILLVTAMGIVLVAGIVATTSRAGLALAVLALLAMPVIYRPDWRWLTGGAIALALAVLALLQVPALAPVFDRFALIGGDQRLTMAATSWKAAEAFFPWGSGWGSFVPVYMAFEDLDTMDSRFVVAAHNDYLQLVLEGGLIGLAAALAAPLALLGAGARMVTFGSSPVQRALWAAAALLLLHSAVDFPLRTPALAALLAIAFASQEFTRRPLPPAPGGG